MKTAVTLAAAVALSLAAEATAGPGQDPPRIADPQAADSLALGSGPAEDAPRVLRLDLRQAVRRALDVSAALSRLEALELTAEADVEAARAERRPELEASVAYARRSHVPELEVTLPSGDRETLFPDIPNEITSGLSLRWPLYSGGRTAARVRAARHERAALENEREAGARDLALSVVDAWWALVSSRERSRVLAGAMQSYDAHLAEARERERIGLATPDEVLAVGVDRERAALAQLVALRSAGVASARLARLLDLEPGLELEPEEPLSAAEPVAAGREELLAEALGHSRELAALEGRVEAARAGVSAARAGRRPRVSLDARWDLDRPNRFEPPLERRFDDSWQVAVGVSLPLWDGGRTTASLSRSRALVEAARHELERRRRDLRLEVETRRLELATSRDEIAVASASLEAARESLRVARQRWEAGVLRSSALLDAETALLQAGLDRTEALARSQVARARLDRLLGRLP